MDKDQYVTGRSTARRNKREARNNREEEANLGQVLRVTPDRDRRETLATAIVLQRARAAVVQNRFVPAPKLYFAVARPRVV